MWKIKNVKADRITCRVKYNDLSVGASEEIQEKICTDTDLDALESLESAGMINILDIEELDKDFIELHTCPVCGGFMEEDDELLQHSECSKCGYFENIYGNAIDFYGKELFEEKKKEILS